RTLRALDEFHVGGLPTNLRQLRSVLTHPEMRAGDARTSFFSDHPDIATLNGAKASGSNSLALLEQQATALGGGKSSLAPATQPVSTSLPVPDGEEGVESPMTGSIIEIAVQVGATIEPGATLMVISAMKMETAITAPCSGLVTALSPSEIGTTVGAGQIIATIAPISREGASQRSHGVDTWGPMLADVRALQEIALRRFRPDSDDPGVIR